MRGTPPSQPAAAPTSAPPHKKPPHKPTPEHPVTIAPQQWRPTAQSAPAKLRAAPMSGGGADVEVRARRLLAEFERLAHAAATKRTAVMTPASQRKCRDVLCLAVLLTSWLCMFVIGLVALNTGDPDILVHSYDYQGNVCGSCPGNTTCGRSFEVVFPTLVQPLVVCVDACPKAATQVCDYNASRCFETFTDYKALFFRCAPASTWSTQSNCTSSPFAVAHGLPVPVLVSDAHCGVCLEPVNGTDGLAMDPGSPQCIAKQVSSVSRSISEQAHPSLAAAAGLYSELFVRLVSDLSLEFRAVAVGGGPVAMVAALAWIWLLGVLGRVAMYACPALGSGR